MNKNPYLKSLLYIGLSATLFVFLFISNKLFFPFITGKGFLFRAVAEIMFSSWLFLAIKDERYRPKWSFVLGSMFLFTISLFVSDILSVNIFKSFWSNLERMEGWFLLIHLFAYFVAVSSFLKTERAWGNLFHAFLGTGFFIGLYSILQLSGEIIINQGGVRVDGTFGNSSYLAVFLLFAIFLSVFYWVNPKFSNSEKLEMVTKSIMLGLSFFVVFPLFLNSTRVNLGPEGSQNLVMGPVHGWVLLGAILAIVGLVFLLMNKRSINEKKEKWIVRFGYGSMIAMFSVILYHTATRGSILGLIGGLLLSTILIAIFEKENKIYRNVSIGVILCIAIIISSFVAFKERSFISDSPTLSRFSSISLSKEDTKTRFRVWKMAIEGAKEKPVFGWGQESFNHVFNKYYDPKLLNQEQWFDRAHNVVLDWLVAGGILGLVFYLSIFASILYYLWGKRDFIKLASFTVVYALISALYLKYFYSNSSIYVTLAVLGIVFVLGLYLISRKYPFEKDNITVPAIATGMLSAYLFQNLFVFDNIGSYVVFVSFVAYIHSVYSKESVILNKVFSFFEKWKKIWAVVLIVVTFGCLYTFVYKGYSTAENLIVAIRKGTKENKLDYTKNIEGFKKAYSQNTIGRQEVVEQVVLKIPEIKASNLKVGEKGEFYTFAKDIIKKEIDASNQDARVLYFQGVLSKNLDERENAVLSLRKALESSPNKQTIMFNLGASLIETGKKEEALQIFKTAYELAPEFINSKSIYAVGAIETNNLELADELISEMRKEENEKGNQYVPDSRIIQGYLNGKHFKKVTPLLEEVINSNPDNPDYRRVLAGVYYEIGEDEKAIEQVNKIKEIFPDKKDEVDKSIEEMRKSLK